MRTVNSKVTLDVVAGGAAAARGAARTFMGVAGFCLLTGLAAQIRFPVPGTEVPATLQVLAVLLAGMTLAPAAAAGSMLAYLALGACGVPLFTPGSAGLLGPTGGYIVGFVVAAWSVSLCRGTTGAGFGRLFAAGAIGLVVLFTVGVGWRVVWFGGDLGLAVATGLVPFAAKAVVELLLAATVSLKLRGWHGRRLGCD